jgi:hypothetical protein
MQEEEVWAENAFVKRFVVYPAANIIKLGGWDLYPQNN